MNVINLIIGLYSLRILNNILGYINLWWVKEYRWDRMQIHLGTQQGKFILFMSFLKKPPISPKTISLFFLITLTIVLTFIYLPFVWWIKLLLCDLISFPISIFWVLMLKIPTIFYHQLIIKQAINKLRNHKQMKVIGITGSFGKTSTKEFLYTILSQQYQVFKTEASKNSPIGIAEAVNQSLKPNDEIAIFEMGAYKQGEIKQMAEMVKPQIGIITAINEQHQDLFKTIENTMQAKYELIQGLKNSKIAIFNADNEYTLKLANQAHQENYQVVLYTTQNNILPKLVKEIVKASEIQADLDSIKFILHYKDQQYPISINISGVHQISNILAAICGSLSCGMTISDIIPALNNLSAYEKTMEKIKGFNGSFFINDTFNNNPDAAIAAIDYLNLGKAKKILVFQPMIELGNFVNEAHKRVGAYAAGVCDVIYLTNENFNQPFIEGVKLVNEKLSVKILSPNDIALDIKKMINIDDVIMFKGKEAENVLRILQ
jgi:UDP-N-acetylmuramoyl-tripeptide--D-alanyl-D-alanine ligase